MQKMLLACGLMSVAALAGCRQDMHNQPKFIPQRGTTFYADGRSVRPQVEQTVARGQLHEDTYFYTGMQNGQEGTTMPFPVTMDVLARGQEKYNVFCTPCHSRVGNGVGMIVQRGYAKAGNFHTDRLRQAPLGHFYTVIANGYGAMPTYAAQLTPEERWSVVAYVRALQLSQNAQDTDIASGQHPQPLSEISEHEGLAANFASEWALPPTAVTGTSNGKTYVLPPDARNAEGGPYSPIVNRQAAIAGPGGQSSTGYPAAPVHPSDGR